MVRKRPYKFEDSEDSDSDYVPEKNIPEPKRYSLRTRTKQTFFEDYDYDIEGSDTSSERQPSDDDDYIVEGDKDHLAFVSYIEAQENHLKKQKLEAASNLQSDNGLIDFEDIIRADIVVNTRKNSCDNGNANVANINSIPEKNDESVKTVKELNDEVNDQNSSLFEPETAVVEDDTKQNLEKDDAKQSLEEDDTKQSVEEDSESNKSKELSLSHTPGSPEPSNSSKELDQACHPVLQEDDCIDVAESAKRNDDDVILIDKQPDVIVLDEDD